MSIIDLRCRPAYLHDFFGATPGSPEYETARWLNRRVGTKGDDAHFARSLTPDGFLAEIRDAGLARAVVVGRPTPSQHLPNDRIHEIVSGHAELIGIGARKTLTLQPDVADTLARLRAFIDAMKAALPQLHGMRPAPR